MTVAYWFECLILHYLCFLPLNAFILKSDILCEFIRLCIFIYIGWKIFKGINQVAIRFVNVLAWLVEFRMRDVSDLYLLMSLLLTKNSFRYGVFRPDV